MLIGFASVVSGVVVGAAAVALDIPWWAQAIVGIVAAMGTALAGLASKLLIRGFDYLQERTKWAFIERVKAHAVPIALRLIAEEIEALKEAAADGKLTKEERQKFLAIAVDELRNLFGLKLLSNMLGAENVNSTLQSVVEESVAVAKAVGPTRAKP